MLDPLRDEAQAVPYDEDAWRRGQVSADVDHDAVTAREERLHGVAVDGDHPEVVGLGPELVADEGIGEQPRLLDLLQLRVPGSGPRCRSYIDLRHDAVALGRGVGTGRQPAGRRPAPRAPFVPQQVGAAAQVLCQRLAVVLCENAGRAAADELVQVRGIAPDGERGRAQVRAAIGHQP